MNSSSLALQMSTELSIMTALKLATNAVLYCCVPSDLHKLLLFFCRTTKFFELGFTHKETLSTP